MNAGPAAMYQPRDFIETPDRLIFAVVDSQLEEDRVLCFLRYVKIDGQFTKMGTREANAYLEAHAPQYLFSSKRLDARLHAVSQKSISRHYRPQQRVQDLLSSGPHDEIERKAVRLMQKLGSRGLDLSRLGLTGSLLIGAQTPKSDLDFVIYGREAFFQAREIVGRLLETGELRDLDDAAWRDAYDRRGCALSFEEYVWHERRKLNKALIDGTKFDITLVDEPLSKEPGAVRKLGPIRIRAQVADATYAFDYPAVYRLSHPEITEAISFTHTYAGQAQTGETIEIAGLLEESETGTRRVIAGSSREAQGEYIKVVG
ncbi:nucleotidyltransferase domain-containing protein [Methylocaldum szegediense]|uniref:NTP_transf_2 domain-containing protein n=1 Tax=Methylocaldum szegediense TaxID=73780 RepID=A0ABM9I408_9GAMM|nr:nucleotidyltransferase domain-containing protein [Methylocaldum szegediense]CAI8876660.1 NTP_transf_2 domain-containing protein [Methylocaldum szegediense]